MYCGINSSNKSMEGNTYPKMILLLYTFSLSPLPQLTEPKETSAHQTKKISLNRKQYLTKENFQI
jgi:hypothetical protein